MAIADRASSPDEPDDTAHNRTTGPSSFDGRDLQILQSLRRIVRAVDLYSHRLKSQYNLTVPQLVCLRAVVDAGEATVSEVARAVYLSASTVVGILDRLEKRGLVERRRDRTDRRVVHVLGTAAGRALIEQAPSPLHDDFRRALGDLAESEQQVIADALSKIVDLMEAGDLDAAPILDPAPSFSIQESRESQKSKRQGKA